MIGRMLAIAVIAGVALGCAPGVPTRTARPTSAFSVPGFPAVLNVDGRGNPPVVIEIGALDVAHLSCSDGLILTPGTAGVPPLPWDLRVIDGSDGRVLLATHVDELPQWLVLIGDEAGIGSIPVAGPSGPPCPSAAGESPSPPPSATETQANGDFALPTAPPIELPAGAAVACAGIEIVAVLHGDLHDPHLAWLITREGTRIDILWPAAYRARFVPTLEVLDETGAVVLRDGDHVTGGCVTGDPAVLDLEPPFN